MQRITITVSDTPHPLAQDQNIDRIEAAALEAVRGGGDIVKVTLYGNRELAILVSPGVPITFEVAEVPEESRDDGDLDNPFEPDSAFLNDYLS
ncbi:hypothetical protein N1027_11455 [Herbiconiux sp. CPCC 205763]|uniref:Uncharacterized protein n=1 Tax=Herbiconiux aconitum TaxID=2970913 RepID=A0ABT2GRA0_9MICO|nr:hypothetical protein [Herbiconiux aconitum]MCS5718749.1 hypothetical protein [Herbiconiux aconitum]